VDSADTELKYHSLVIEASSKNADIWLADDNGHFVQKGKGVLSTSLLPGNYVVEFTLGSTVYPINLNQPLQLTEQKIKSGSSCQRPVVKFADENES